MVGNSSEHVALDAESLSTVVGNYRRRRGRPSKSVDLALAMKRLKGRESLRSVAKALGVSHSTLREHLQRSGLMEGFDY